VVVDIELMFDEVDFGDDFVDEEDGGPVVSDEVGSLDVVGEVDCVELVGVEVCAVEPEDAEVWVVVESEDVGVEVTKMEVVEDEEVVFSTSGFFGSGLSGSCFGGF